MIRSAVILLALFSGKALGGIPIPNDNCEWRYNGHGAWNQCFANEIAIGKLLFFLFTIKHCIILFQHHVAQEKTQTASMVGPAMEFYAVICQYVHKMSMPYIKELISNLSSMQDYMYTEYEEVTGGHGVNVDCGQKPICGECGSGKNEDCNGHSTQVSTSSIKWWAVYTFKWLKRDSSTYS